MSETDEIELIEVGVSATTSRVWVVESVWEFWAGRLGTDVWNKESKSMLNVSLFYIISCVFGFQKDMIDFVLLLLSLIFMLN